MSKAGVAPDDVASLFLTPRPGVVHLSYSKIACRCRRSSCPHREFPQVNDPLGGK